jgi:hypothetical protein
VPVDNACQPGAASAQAVFSGSVKPLPLSLFSLERYLVSSPERPLQPRFCLQQNQFTLVMYCADPVNARFEDVTVRINFEVQGE